MQADKTRQGHPTFPTLHPNLGALGMAHPNLGCPQRRVSPLQGFPIVGFLHPKVRPPSLPPETPTFPLTPTQGGHLGVTKRPRVGECPHASCQGRGCMRLVRSGSIDHAIVRVD
ncbi:hypothetical protein EMPS_08385 [Entomortierella parvispora]|uniref:Uncharacterized protein n=1 Tax=Entomortierella parvispora TaxID=205924 RepID=A0A9P3LZD6_9FUNG|nr:hypothetical protein EMPS_08385 [Entomortierella parvispora]